MIAIAFAATSPVENLTTSADSFATDGACLGMQQKSLGIGFVASWEYTAGLMGGGMSQRAYGALLARKAVQNERDIEDAEF